VVSALAGRVQITTRVLHTRTFYIGSQPTDVDSGDVTVTVRRMDGTTVDQPDGNTAQHLGVAGSGQYTYRPAAVSLVDVHSLTWSGVIAGATVELVDYVDYTGGYTFGLAQMRGRFGGLAQYSDAALDDARTSAEAEAERICGVAFVPRFAWCTVYGNGSPWLPLVVNGMSPRAINAVRAVSIGGTAMEPDVRAGLVLSPTGALKRPGGAIWPLDTPVRVEFEHGYTITPSDMPEPVMKRARYWRGLPTTGVPDRATSWTTNDGGTYRFSMPGADYTGDPDVDAVYSRHGGASTRRRSVIA
jgi:hypothetical protein